MSIDFENMTYEVLDSCKRSARLEYAAYWQRIFEAGIQLEWLARDGNRWVKSELEVVYDSIYRRKPQPKLVPLDFSDILIGVPIVDNNGDRKLIGQQTESGVLIEGYIRSYEFLQKHFTRLDGSRFEKEIHR